MATKQFIRNGVLHCPKCGKSAFMLTAEAMLRVSCIQDSDGLGATRYGGVAQEPHRYHCKCLTCGTEFNINYASFAELKRK